MNILRVLAALELASSLCCTYCTIPTGSGCTQCIPSFYLSSFICGRVCGEGFTLSGNACILSGSAAFINTYFSSSIEKSTSTIGNFQTSDSTFFSHPQNMIPAHDRGFYTGATSNLVGNSPWKLGPDFTIRLCFRPMATNGIIMKIISIDSSNFLQILLVNSELVTKLSVLGQQDSAVHEHVNINSFASTVSGSWINAVIEISQKDPTTVNSKISLVQGVAITTAVDSEVLINDIQQWVIGDPIKLDTLIGFYYYIGGANELGNSFFSPLPTNICDIGYYFSASSCFPCDPACGAYAICLDQYSCALCYFAQCSSCNMISAADCHSCTNGYPAPYCCPIWCRSCTNSFDCIACQQGSYLFNGMCLNGEPYQGQLPSTDPVLVLDFSIDFTGNYSNFTAGSNSLSFQPFEVPEVNDPIPCLGRGLYFTGSSYLENLNFQLPHTLSVSFLLKPTTTSDLYIFNIPEHLAISSSGRIYSVLSMDDGSTSTYTSAQVMTHTSWTSLSVSIDYSIPFTTISIYINNAHQLTSSTTGVLRIPSALAYIGAFFNAKYDPCTNCFQGFIFIASFWNIALYSFASSLSICDNAVTTSCLWDCDISGYYIQGLGYSNCMTSCINGCRNGDTCNICSDSLCEVCSGFGNTSCLVCKNNTSIGVTNMCECNPGRVYVGGECLMCHSTCSSCVGIHKNECLGCVDVTQVLAGGFCFYQCPDGSVQVGNECTPTDYLIARLKLNGVTSYGMINNFTIGSSNDTAKDPNDPSPVTNRGYYFTNSSYMAKANSSFYIEFTISFWFKAYSSGVILNKLNYFSIFYNSPEISVSLLQNSTILSNLVCKITQNWNHLLIITTTHSVNYFEFIILLNGVYNYSVLFDIELWRPDRNSAFFIGDLSNTFTGFIWSLDAIELLDYTLGSTTSCIGNCMRCPEEEICPSECDLNCNEADCGKCCQSTCKNCTYNGECLNCYPQAVLSRNDCTCQAGTIWNSTLIGCVLDCFDTCGSCNNLDFQGCLTCKNGYYLFNGVCAECSIGFNMVDSLCVRTFQLIFNLDFSKTLTLPSPFAVGDRRTQSVNSNPLFAYSSRGCYFNGIHSFLSYSDQVILFNPEYSIEIWFMPTNLQGVLISKEDLKSLPVYFQIKLVSGQIFLTVFNSASGANSLNLGVAAVINQWNYLKLATRSSSKISYELLVYFNKNSSLQYQFPQISYNRDASLSSTTLGAASSPKSSFFSGFMHLLRIYNLFIAGPTSSDCNDSCLSCSPSGQCLPICSISEYWLGFNYTNCTSCYSSCTEGCRDGRKSCSLCDDLLCASCSANLSSCDICIENAQKNITTGLCECENTASEYKGVCVKCVRGYFNASKCVDCEEKCEKCNQSACEACVEFSSQVDGKCECELGYNGEKDCNWVDFYVNTTVGSDNSVFIDFSDAIREGLKKTDIEILIKNVSIDFKFEVLTETRYKLSIIIENDIKFNESAILRFKQQIVSTGNGILHLTDLGLNLFSYTLSTSISKVAAATAETAGKAAVSITSAVSSLSLVNPNPASFWSFVNTIQLLIFIYLIEIPLNDRITGFLLGLRKYQIFPNIFSYFNSEYGSKHGFAHATKLGFKTDSVLVNVGNWISCFLFFVVLYYVMKIIYELLQRTRFKKSFVANKLQEKCQGYHYGFFLRFWIQAYVEILVACLLAIFSANISKVGQALNFYLALVLLLIIVVTPAASFFIIKNNHKSSGSSPRQQELWATLFYEFKEDSGTAQSQFYTIFFMRRLIYIFIIFVLRDYPIIQMCLIEITSLTMFYFIFYMKPFSEKALHIANCVSEFGLALSIPLFTVYLFDIAENSRHHLEYVLIVVVNLIVVSQIIATLYIFIKAIVIKIKNRKMARVQDKADDKEFKIFFQGAEEIKAFSSAEDEVIIKNQLHVSPNLSCQSSINSEYQPEKSLIETFKKVNIK